MKNNKKDTIFNTLQSGICEIIYKDVHSVENSIMATLAPNHLPSSCTDDIAVPDMSLLGCGGDDTIVVAFNVNTEKWENVLVDSVIDIEQLTGEGAPNNEKKLQAGPEYMEQLESIAPPPPPPRDNNNDCIIDDGDYDATMDDILFDDDDDSLFYDDDDDSD